MTADLHPAAIETLSATVSRIRQATHKLNSEYENLKSQPGGLKANPDAKRIRSQRRTLDNYRSAITAVLDECVMPVDPANLVGQIEHRLTILVQDDAETREKLVKRILGSGPAYAIEWNWDEAAKAEFKAQWATKLLDAVSDVQPSAQRFTSLIDHMRLFRDRLTHDALNFYAANSTNPVACAIENRAIPEARRFMIELFSGAVEHYSELLPAAEAYEQVGEMDAADAQVEAANAVPNLFSIQQTLAEMGF